MACGYTTGLHSWATQQWEASGAAETRGDVRQKWRQAKQQQRNYLPGTEVCREDAEGATQVWGGPSGSIL